MNGVIKNDIKPIAKRPTPLLKMIRSIGLNYRKVKPQPQDISNHIFSVSLIAADVRESFEREPDLDQTTAYPPVLVLPPAVHSADWTSQSCPLFSRQLYTTWFKL